MENVKKFYNALASDQALQEKAWALEAKIDRPLDEATAKAKIIAFANAEGYDFSAADFDAYARVAKPLGDETLDAVAGGAFSSSCICVVGGGGSDPVTGHTCACVIGGSGKDDEKGYSLHCFVAGTVK